MSGIPPGTIQGVTVTNGSAVTSPTRPEGRVPTVRIARTLTTPPGSPARVANLGDPRNVLLGFAIPQGREGQPGIRGYPGADGRDATLQVGSTTTLPPGEPAVVTNTGTPNAGVFNFYLPAGPPGPGLNPKGEIATEADLPTVGNEVGDMYLVQSNGIAYVWHGTGWQTLGELVSGGLPATGGTLWNPGQSDPLTIQASAGQFARINFRLLAPPEVDNWAVGGTPAGHFEIRNTSNGTNPLTIWGGAPGDINKGNIYVNTGGLLVGQGPANASLHPNPGTVVINENTGGFYPPLPAGGTNALQLIGADGSPTRLLIDAYGVPGGGAPNILFRHGQGIAAGVTPTFTGDPLGLLAFLGTGTFGAFNPLPSGWIYCRAIGPWNATAAGCQFEFQTVPPGSPANASYPPRVIIGQGMRVGDPGAVIDMGPGTVNAQGYFVNGQPLGSIGGGTATWGGITGTLSAQADLNAALNTKQAILQSGTSIKTINSESLLGPGNIAIGSGSGTVNNGTVGQIAYYASSGTAVSGTSIKTINSESLLGTGNITITGTGGGLPLTGGTIYSPGNSDPLTIQADGGFPPGLFARTRYVSLNAHGAGSNHGFSVGTTPAGHFEVHDENFNNNPITIWGGSGGDSSAGSVFIGINGLVVGTQAGGPGGNGSMGIGTVNATNYYRNGVLFTGGDGGGLPQTGGSLANPSATTLLTLDNFGGVLIPTTQFRSAGGSSTLPQATTGSVNLGLIRFSGHDGSAYRDGATITAQSASGVTWNPGNAPTQLIFSTTRTGSGNTQQAMRIDASGGVVIGNPSGNNLGPGTLNAQNLYIGGITLEDYIKTVAGI